MTWWTGGARSAAPQTLLTAVALALLLAAADPLRAADTLVRRDGTRESGALQACTQDRCQWAGRALPRAEIAWIGFGESGAPPAPADPAQDTVWLRDGKSVAGAVAGISLGVVAVAGQSLDRPDVAWVYFGSSAGLPPHAAKPPRTPAAPSPVERPRSRPAPLTPSAAPAAAPASPPATLLLNELRFRPAEGEAPFVEIRNASAKAMALDGATLTNEKGKTVELPRGTPIEPGAFLLVLFDGKKSAEPGIAHAPAAEFLGRESGALALRTKEGIADAVTWGLPDLSSVDLCRGGRCSPPRAGSVLARLPDVARPSTSEAWAPLDPQLATPGQPNPRPPVSAFAGIPGLIYPGKPRFSWYSVPGAARYRVQVAREEAFASLLHESVVDAQAGARLHQLTTHGPELPAGDYFWRVLALDAGGESAAPSAPMPFRIDPSRSALNPPRVSAPAQSAERTRSRAQHLGDGGAARAAAEEPSSPRVVRKVLPVPVIRHQKDTKMLALESWSEASPGSWDTPDQAGYPYCARAGVAMISAYYHTKLNLPGKLSQDRIGYEAFKDLRRGDRTPEYDLPATGIADERLSEHVLPFALGTSGDYHLNPGTAVTNPIPGTPSGDNAACDAYARERILEECAPRGGPPDSEECRRHRVENQSSVRCPPQIRHRYALELSRNIKTEIDAGRPLIATSEAHLFLIVGYEETGDAEAGGSFAIVYQDEGGPLEFEVTLRLFSEAYVSYWTGLAPVKLGSDEPTIRDQTGRATDSDNDGVIDFDEINRFGTERNKPDSDDDGVEDKKEIRYSVWDSDHGYHRTVVRLPSSGFDSQIQSFAAAANLTGRDPDRDGKAMERDPDSDDGGCKDGEENLNADGVRDPSETSNFLKADDPVTDGECAALWTGTSRTRFWSRRDNNWDEIIIDAEYRLREHKAMTYTDPGPARGGRRANAPIGKLIHLNCEGTTLRASWRYQHWDSNSSCTCAGDGETPVPPSVGGFDGFIHTKSVDWDLTPIYGFDVPREGGLYSVSCKSREGSAPLTLHCSCTDDPAGAWTDDARFPYPAGFGLGNPDTEVRCNHDPKVRSLEGGGNRMTGTYSIHVPECAPQGADMTWSLCKAGTPCAPLPPLPGTPVAPAPPE